MPVNGDLMCARFQSNMSADADKICDRFEVFSPVGPIFPNGPTCQAEVVRASGRHLHAAICRADLSWSINRPDKSQRVRLWRRVSSSLFVIHLSLFSFVTILVPICLLLLPLWCFLPWLLFFGDYNCIAKYDLKYHD